MRKAIPAALQLLRFRWRYVLVLSVPPSISVRILPDDFVCDLCCAHGIKRPDPDANARRHTYTHPLVPCKPPSETPEVPALPNPEPASATEVSGASLAALEQRIVAMDTRFEQLEGRFSHMETQFEAHLARVQRELQEELLSQFNEMLVRVFAPQAPRVEAVNDVPGDAV